MFHGACDDQSQVPVEWFQIKVPAFLQHDVGGYGFASPRISHRDLEAILTAITGLRLIKGFTFSAIDLEDHTVRTLPIRRDQRGFAGTVFADL